MTFIIVLILVVLANWGWRVYWTHKNRPFIGEWHSDNFCTHCRGYLSYHKKMYSHGTCPYCGHIGENSVTIVETRKIVSREVRNEWAGPIETQYRSLDDKIWLSQESDYEKLLEQSHEDS